MCLFICVLSERMQLHFQDGGWGADREDPGGGGKPFN